MGKLISEVLSNSWNNIDVTNISGLNFQEIVTGILWILFWFLYFVLKKYDKQRGLGRGKTPVKTKNNVGKTLWLFIGLTILDVFIHKLGVLNICWLVIPTSLDLLRKCVIFVGMLLAFFGLWLVVDSRIFLNGYWGEDIYDYSRADPDGKISKHELITKGPYSKMRHPIYFGQALMTIGTALALNSWFILVLAIIKTGFNIRRGVREDRYLKIEFPEWKDYKSNTDFWF